MIHSCNPSPPLPRGLTRLCSGPAPNPSREIEKLSTLSLLNVASYLAILFDAQRDCRKTPGSKNVHENLPQQALKLPKCCQNVVRNTKNQAVFSVSLPLFKNCF